MTEATPVAGVEIPNSRRTQSRTGSNVGHFPTSLAVADLDRNGMPDLAANSILEGTVSIFLNPGSDSSERILVVLPPHTVPYAVLVGEWRYPGFSGLAIVCDDGIRMIALRP